MSQLIPIQVCEISHCSEDSVVVFIFLSWKTLKCNLYWIQLSSATFVLHRRKYTFATVLWTLNKKKY